MTEKELKQCIREVVGNIHDNPELMNVSDKRFVHD